MRYGTLTLALLFPLAAAAQPAEKPSWSFEHMMQQRSQVQSARAGFVEVRKLSSGQTHKSSGTLAYRAPGVLERQTSTPVAERIVIEDDRMIMEIEIAAGQQPTRREFPLSRVPAMRPFFVALRSLLAGDTETLRRTFEVAVDGDESAWKIQLIPREQADKQTRDIVFRGQGNELRTVELRQKNGDSSTTSLTPVSVELKPNSARPTLSRGG